MMNYEQALTLCRNEPESAAGLICDLSIRVDTQQQIELLQKTGADLARVGLSSRTGKIQLDKPRFRK